MPNNSSNPQVVRWLAQRRMWFTLSLVLTLASVALLWGYGLRIGIDFTGGQLLELRYLAPVASENLRDRVTQAEAAGIIPAASVAPTDEASFLIRTRASSEELDRLRTTLSEVGEWEELRFENVGPTVGQDLTRKAIWAIVLASGAIILYIAWAFRRVPAPTNSWRFGVTAVIALLHDLLITVGAFALLGHLFGYEVDSLFITAMLTVMGFSVHDTIVTYDRIRENLLRNPTAPFEDVVNVSVAQTVVRSISTSLTLVLVLTTLLLLGGSSIRAFTSALLIGVIVGVYSSIFLAAQLLIVWQKVKSNRA
ncbi:protein translocase subunit SecF [Candidatus Berkelbacteria bacterium]|nr:protein translocase subunit SecF [Candidatus Berkelbacteria bacterium]